MELKSYHHDLINEVIDNFDFEKVARVMKALDWKWATDNGGYEVPDIYDLRKNARARLKEVIKSSIEEYDGSGVTISCGGFEAFYRENTKDISLKFVLSYWDAYMDDDGSIMCP